MSRNRGPEPTKDSRHTEQCPYCKWWFMPQGIRLHRCNKDPNYKTKGRKCTRSIKEAQELKKQLEELGERLQIMRAFISGELSPEAKDAISAAQERKPNLTLGQALKIAEEAGWVPSTTKEVS